MAIPVRSERFSAGTKPRAPAPDGRIARGQRTRDAILEAYEALIADSQGSPTGADLAQRAGVSARSIFTHFGDMDGVLTAAWQRVSDWILATHVDVPLDLPLEERLVRFTVRQGEVLERAAPLYRLLRSLRGTRQKGCSPVVRQALTDADQLRRRYIDHLFGAELRLLDEEERGEVAEAFVVSSSWNAWEGLRVEQGLDVAQSRRVMRRTLAGLFQ